MKAFIIIIMVLFVGCASTNYWDDKIGTYTLDEAKIEFGPPDSTAKLEDGGMVISWITDLRNSPERRVLRFDKNGKLVSGSTRVQNY